MNELRLLRDPRSNIAYYTEPGRERDKDAVWAEVLRSDMYYTGSGKRRVRHERTIPRFHITVYRAGNRQVARRTYQPRQPVPAGPLDARRVTLLVRKMLADCQPPTPTEVQDRA